MVLLVLLAVAMAFVLWYVIDRRAKLHATPPPVDLAKHDGQTIDFSSGKPVVKDSAEDKAAIEKAAKEMEEAVKDVSFGPPVKKKEPAPAPPKN